METLISSRLYMHLPYHENSGYWHPFYWDVEQKAELTPIRLAYDQGWIKQTDVEYALLEWLAVEEAGFASPDIQQYWDGDDREKILLTDEVRQYRQATYTKLIDYVQNTLSEVEAYSLSARHSYRSREQGIQWSFIVGKQSNGDWMGIAPTMPRETGDYLTELFDLSASTPIEPDLGDAAKLPAPLTALIAELPPIKIYGWYDGGYNHVHFYGLQVVYGKSRDAAIERLWQKAQLLEMAQFNQFHYKLGEHYSRISRFLQSAVSEPTLYRFCLWDLEMLYLTGKVEGKNQVGMCFQSQFTYNP